MKMYEVMQIKSFKKTDRLCEYGTQGDRFFIILEGTVGVRVPTWYEQPQNSIWSVLQFVINEYDNVMSFRDPCTRDCAQIVRILGHKFLSKQSFARVTTFVEFLVLFESQDPELL